MVKERALITGASAGIGAAYAEQLAERGSDLVLVARRIDRLEESAKNLSERFGIEAEALQADLASGDGLRAATDRAARGDITLLINNAGFGGYRAFAEVDVETIDALIDVHIRASARLVRAALPGMLARGSGSIVNVASLLAFSGTLPAKPLPQRTVYAAAKSFLVTFTQTLAAEIAGTGVRAQVFCPGVVATEFHEIQGITGLPNRMSAEEAVSWSLRGLESDEVICIPWPDRRSVIDAVGEAQRALFAGTR